MQQQRIRIRWTKQGRTRFVSARDLTSVWERALRRADLPIAYSEGFTPHAKVSFPDALSVGYESTGEYAELTFAVPIAPAGDLARLSATLPEGMDITTYLEVPDGAPKLARMLRATLWEQEWPSADAAALADLLRRRSDALLAADRAEVVRHRPDGDRTIDVRPAILALAVSYRAGSGGGDATTDGARTVLRAVLRNDGPTVRPHDLKAALSHDDVADPPITRRVAQGEHVEQGLREALSGQVEPLVLDVDAEAA
ncbi:TIGR03936 family radical SAM-associated protein [Egicoccus halophilus]|uniref:Radical SAM protein n=1 Tax=Egicoccus halophilus TaxID=1670830 RepID=A0A8J3AFI7_9ACTN|nr:TIGR03936 family radical SAM-associated protein [Egicoccus halophilus]GGI06817.1 radical SAM protein [Egicoccus halophilus]